MQGPVLALPEFLAEQPVGEDCTCGVTATSEALLVLPDSGVHHGREAAMEHRHQDFTR